MPIQSSQFTQKSRREHLEELIAGVFARTRLRNARELGVYMKLMQLVARKFAKADSAIWTLRHTNDPFNAVGDDLDAIAEVVLPEGQRRKDATHATTSLVFTRVAAAGALPIPAGTLAAQTTPDGDVLYQTTAAGAIPDGAGSNAAAPIPAICLEAGAKGSAHSGAISTLVSNLDNVTGVSNVTPATGLDREEDEDLLDRMIAYTVSLPRCTEPAIVGALRQVELSDGRRIPFVTPVANLAEPGTGIVYVDDGMGTIGQSEAAAAETIVQLAHGGEFELYTSRRPWNSPPTFTLNGGALVEGVDYASDPAAGMIQLFTPLSADDVVLAGAYSVWGGLIAEGERRLAGDPSNRSEYPGYRAWSTFPRLWPATALFGAINGKLTVKNGYTAATVRLAARDAIIRYVNSLAIGAPRIHGRIIERALSVRGAYKLNLLTPTQDSYPLVGQVYRANTESVTLT